MATTATRPVNGVEVPVPGTYALDLAHSHVGFVVRHLMVSKVRGRFAGFTGTIEITDDPQESALDVEIDVKSIDTRDEQRDAHLRSPDFFDADNHPHITYRSTNITHAGANTWLVDGDLTVRGVTKPVQLEVTFEGAATDPWGNTKVGFSATAELNREDFGLTWNQQLETGGVLVGKTVKLEIEAEALRQERGSAAA